MTAFLGCVLSLCLAVASFILSAVVVGVWLNLMLLWAGR
jgi:hypothetical protein